MRVNAVEYFSLDKKRRWECEGANEKLQGGAVAVKPPLFGFGMGFRQRTTYDYLNIAF